MKNGKTKVVIRLESNTPLTSARGLKDLSNETMAIKKVMSTMKVDKNKPFFVPAQMAETPSRAGSMLKSAKERLVKEDKTFKSKVFVIRTIKDSNRKYIGSRVWRIA